jgi:hypothetical protein
MRRWLRSTPFRHRAPIAPTGIVAFANAAPDPSLRQNGGGRVPNHVPGADLPAATAAARNQSPKMVTRLRQWRALDLAPQT